jgi:hypothetical protein
VATAQFSFVSGKFFNKRNNSMSSIFVMYEHNNSRSGAFDMAHIMASPNVAGLVSPAFSFGDIYAGNFSLVDATFAAAKGKPVVSVSMHVCGP